jgi:mRNA interferase HicA
VQQRNSSVALCNTLMYHLDMTSAQFKRWLEKQGCTFEPAKGGHLKVFFGKQASILPMHGSSKEIGKGLEHRIKKDLGLK